MNRFTITPPSGNERPLNEMIRRRSVYAEDIRIINPLRIEQVFVCAGNAKVREAISDMSGTLPWVNAKKIRPDQLQGKISDEHFVLLLDDSAAPFFRSERFNENHPRYAIAVLLSSNDYIGCAPPHEAALRYPYVANIELVFHFDETRPPSLIMPAAIRCAEDRMNIGSYSQEKRFIFLVVDDEPRWFSEFLPVLYRIIGQRADILTARTYEEAEQALKEYGDNIVCLISDMNIPRGGIVGPNGKDLVVFAKSAYPRFPIIIASKCEEAKALSDMGLILPKGDAGALKELERYVLDFTGLGDFLFYNEGKLIARAKSLEELKDRITELPIEILELYAKRDYFSTWLYMHGFHGLGDELRPRHDRGSALREMLLLSMREELERVSKKPFIFMDDGGNELAKAGSLKELGERIREVDVSVLEFYSHLDGFSTWLMRRGYSRLAEELRPLHAQGEELRGGILRLIEKEIISAAG